MGDQKLSIQIPNKIWAFLDKMVAVLFRLDKTFHDETIWNQNRPTTFGIWAPIVNFNWLSNLTFIKIWLNLDIINKNSRLFSDLGFLS